MKNAQGKADVIIAIRVFYNETGVVETSAREAFARRGGSKRLLIDTEKRERALSKGQMEIEREPVRLVYPDDFRAPLIAQFLSRMYVQIGACRHLTA
jgi:hypothetical protein